MFFALLPLLNGYLPDSMEDAVDVWFDDDFLVDEWNLDKSSVTLILRCLAMSRKYL